MRRNTLMSTITVIILFSTLGCSDHPGTHQTAIDSLNAANNQLQHQVMNLQEHLDRTTDKYDSLNGVYQSYLHSTKPTKNISAVEQELVGLVKSLNNAFNNLLYTKDVQTVLNHFTDDFTSNVVMVSFNDIVNSRTGNSVTYPQQLEHILIHNEKIQYIEVSLNKIYHIEAKNSDFGVIYFLDDLVIMTDESKKVYAKLLIQIVAKKYQGEWKIGNYTSVDLAEYEVSI